jgi:hypothetical protein
MRYFRHLLTAADADTRAWLDRAAAIHEQTRLSTPCIRANRAVQQLSIVSKSETPGDLGEGPGIVGRRASAVRRAIKS